MTADTVSRNDFRVIGVIGLVHLLSHAFQFALAPLFPVISLPADQGGIGVSYTELGLLASLFFASSGLCQTPAGFVVDKIGARPVLIGGLALLSVGVFAYSLAPNFGVLIALSIMAGIGNSVFHPADYSLINGAVSPARLGRAYSVHSIGGYVGFALAPAVLPLIEPALGWRGAVAVAGAIGLFVAISLIIWRPDTRFDDGAATAAKGVDDQSISGGIRLLMQPAILLGFFFFLALAMGLIGFKTMGPTALHEGWDLSITLSGNAIAAFSVAGIIGIAAGGYWADKSTAHNRNAMFAFLLAGFFVVLIPLAAATTFQILFFLVAAGLCFGSALPNRDLFIRSLTPKGASGRVFGFVYGGLDVGASLTPLFFGFLMDLGRPEYVVLAAGIFMFLAAGVIRLTELVARKVASAR